ncbi:MAG: chromosome segregation protein SMC [Microcystis panniformis Mp_MB_F_20051200_S9]|uniref:Chromosome partition protein Smc n=1 Tax=Microcystis panniformis Mp_MB_F_20051200_S9 TaxID=2486223 RepID=A0A552Q827_9CHRO|nr:MAG: chromosome segregation protein SMC [Microcystis panniformis Mp_MB_F_20080800_S26D]TRV50895.1 MAG: chromosome segregation protein SMC [Microcystis panniformis Mp_GB_SS_20050300_S99D]TRV54568.1 MAG: chromosome segregation protein SMC [Microcystis panniformis Mp_GB_SS_20050300_S99]TRV58313.1 MAG: chromosome segregation protein SMC [Microcystis panniformis Mp_MB_F_20080800_S26]TRV65360.1 MAG: chromosome segregation protein SMC [Microcystis panniformis Mp_MB_F_20051200_S9]TRV67019.1 MAG: ch
MVYIKKVELSHFKSFGGTTPIPFLPGFTVVSGPNGSGKSNILDALLFCLGLATSKGMRAERLPDLVNHSYNNQRHSTEASVSVTFDIADIPDATDRDWTVSRRLKVAKGGSYTSTYYINGETCTVSELHDQLNRLRIYPEGYNVVLQGDVTGIISMNAKERREIIDELAGVAEFDRKIEKTKENIDSVKEREERCQIIATELQKSLEKLALDRIKAEKYQKLKAQVQEKQQWEIVLHWQNLQQRCQQVQGQIQAGEREKQVLTETIANLSEQIAQNSQELEKLNQQVKAFGEDEHLSLTSRLASQQAKRQQQQQRQKELENLEKESQAQKNRLLEEINRYNRELNQITAEKSRLETEILPNLLRTTQTARETLETHRLQASSLAEASEAWVKEQSDLSRNITRLQEQLNPYRSQRAQLTERCDRLQTNIVEAGQRLQELEEVFSTKTEESQEILQKINNSEPDIQNLAQKLTIAEQNRVISQDTQKRLLKEQRDKQRELDKLEATKQAQQEAQGTYATQILLQSDLPGICGLVAQLGEVEERYQIALEIAAGGRLGHVVVQDDSVAAAGIALLKQRRIGRATFLPLNKIRPPRPQDISSVRHARGYLDLAVNLVKFQSQYREVFNYIFGSTVVFEDIDSARYYINQYRIVTLDGELLEMTGAMTGGSQPTRSGQRFGKISPKESSEAESLRERLAEIDRILTRNEEKITQFNNLIGQLTQQLTETRQSHRENQLSLQQLSKDLQRLTTEKEDLTRQLSGQQEEITISRQRLEVLTREIPELELSLQQEQEKLTALEANHTHSEWQQVQGIIRAQELQLQTQENHLATVREQLKDLQNQQIRLEEKSQESADRITEIEKIITDAVNQRNIGNLEIEKLDRHILEINQALQQLSRQLGETKQKRDQLETVLRQQQNQQQQAIWQSEKLVNNQEERQALLTTLQTEISQLESDLPNPLPEIPESERDFEKIQSDIRQLQKKLEALEPVNMLALEEHQKTKERLDELSEKLQTLEGERTELLLRIENFTTLRFNAFQEAFTAVNENFKNIFATLSDGDGYLQLEDENDPFNGGLNLVAHPKGKPVQRLSSMSGGEKSLTALSFIFSLQRYRPSPFYAFDEVDMFLDGANVEKLAKMIQKQAQQAQFIVVSLRRPMIEASERTIGVTQARGTHTQVLGIKV